MIKFSFYHYDFLNLPSGETSTLKQIKRVSESSLSKKITGKMNMIRFRKSQCGNENFIIAIS